MVCMYISHHDYIVWLIVISVHIVKLTFVQFLGCKYKPILLSEVVITYISNSPSLIVKLGRNSLNNRLINKLITFSCSGLNFVQLDYTQHRITYKKTNFRGYDVLPTFSVIDRNGNDIIFVIMIQFRTI